MSFPFKFHCDSINILSFITTEVTVTTFKFHCDSINIDDTQVYGGAQV